MGFGDRLKHAWNAFAGNKDPTISYPDLGMSYYSRPDRPRLSRGNERSIVTSVYNRIALDAAAIRVQHVRLDENERFIETIDSDLNCCLTLEANVDQTGRALIQDAVMSMLDEGCVAIVPIDTTFNPRNTGAYDIQSMRTGRIREWYPAHIKAEVYNEQTGRKEDIIVPKKTVAIIENPLYAVMNEPNSTMQRLIRKLNLLDAVDEQSGSGKLDLIIQLPYVIKTDARRQQAENRRKDIEMQLAGSKYGIAYTDGTEHITQLNRPVENNLMKQVEYLTNTLYGQLGITQTIMDGTADEKTMLNYYNRTIEPILAAIVDEMKRKFLTKTARTQLQSIAFFRDPFKLVPVNDMAEIADKFTRNEIMSSNEIRQIVGMRPSDDPNADQLRNKNLNQATAEMPGGSMEGLDGMPEEAEPDEEPEQMTQEEFELALKNLDDLDAQLDELESELDDDEDEDLKHYASPYYDPVKAHEYYMRTRELKGRRSTAGLSDEGKAAAKYVRESLSSERKQKVKVDKDASDQKVESLRTERKSSVEAYKAKTQSRIDQLRDKLKKMTPWQKAHNKEAIYSEIDGLREDNKRERLRLTEAFKSQMDTVRTNHKETKTRLKEEYDKKYLDELEKIRSDSKFQRVYKRKPKKST